MNLLVFASTLTLELLVVGMAYWFQVPYVEEGTKALELCWAQCVLKEIKEEGPDKIEVKVKLQDKSLQRHLGMCHDCCRCKDGSVPPSHTIQFKDKSELSAGILRLNPEGVVEDMTSLYNMHQAGVLFNLEQRSELSNQLPYTFVANVLVAVNPLQRNHSVPEHGRNLSSLLPHPFSMGETAYQNMVRVAAARAKGRGISETPVHQSVVICGESGAGKTETCEIFLSYLTQANRGGTGDRISNLDQRLLKSNPVLESLGNAKTHRNPNSSRFGKFMKLQYGQNGSDGVLKGASLETYLFEKTRIVFQIEGERNFHIFYMLVKGAKQMNLQKLET